MAFDPIVTNPGVGGASLAMDTFTDTDAVVKTMPFGAVAFGALNGPYTPVDATHGLPVQPQTGSTWAVTGTFWQATQPVSIAGTVAVSAATLPLPTGAATAAKQPAIGTAGTPSADVLSVQGRAGMTALVVDGSAVTQPVSGPLTDGQLRAQELTVVAGAAFPVTIEAVNVTLAVTDGGGSLTVDGSVSVSGLVPGTSATSLGKAEDAVAADGDTGVAVWAVRKDVPATTTGASGDYHPFEVDANGCLWVNGSNYTQPVSGTVAATQSGTWNIGTVTTLTTCSTVTNLSQLGGQAVAMGTGARSAGTQRVTIATDDVVPASQSGTWTVQPGNTANTTPWLVTPAPATSGGPSTSRVKSGASTNATSVKGSAGQVYGWYLFNNTSSAKFVKFYNKASAPTVGSDTPLFTVPLPANGGANVEFSMGIPFGTGVAYAITGAIADSDTTSTAADDVHGVILYK